MPQYQPREKMLILIICLNISSSKHFYTQLLYFCFKVFSPKSKIFLKARITLVISKLIDIEIFKNLNITCNSIFTCHTRYK